MLSWMVLKEEAPILDALNQILGKSEYLLRNSTKDAIYLYALSQAISCIYSLVPSLLFVESLAK